MLPLDDYNFRLKVVDENIVNNFLKVKLIITDTTGLQNYFKYNDTICWIDRKFVMYGHTAYGIGGIGIANWTKNIREIETLRILNSCKYDAVALAQCYQQRGIEEYDTADYSSAIFDLTKSIDIFPYFDKSNVGRYYVIKSYYFRAYAKMKLDDYLGLLMILR